MIQGVIFDMDGLMFDSEVIWYECWAPALGRYGYELPAGLADDCRGRSREGTVEVLARYLGEGVPAGAIIDELRRIACARIESEVRKKPGLDELLAWLGAHGVPCAVASSSPRSLIERCLANAGIADAFSGVMSGEEVERSKPDPEVFLKAAEQIGVAPESALVLEDSPAGVRAGRAGGFVTVMVPDMTAPTPDLAELYDACCESLLEVRDRLEAGTLG